MPARTMLVRFLDRTCVAYEAALRTLCGRLVLEAGTERVSSACPHCARTLDEHLRLGLALVPLSSDRGPTLNSDV